MPRRRLHSRSGLRSRSRLSRRGGHDDPPGMVADAVGMPAADPRDEPRGRPTGRAQTRAASRARGEEGSDVPAGRAGRPGGVLLLIAAGLAIAARKEVTEAIPPAPEQALRSMRQDVAAVKEAAANEKGTR